MKFNKTSRFDLGKTDVNGYNRYRNKGKEDVRSF